MSLAEKDCTPCRGDTPPLTSAEREPLARQVPDWDVVDGHHLRREFRFDDFKRALRFVNAIGEEAERQGHHPDLELSWGRVGVELFTHAIDGLTEADFVLAAKFDRIHSSQSSPDDGP